MKEAAKWGCLFFVVIPIGITLLFAPFFDADVPVAVGIVSWMVVIAVGLFWLSRYRSGIKLEVGEDGIVRGSGQFAVEVVGESYYEKNFVTICGPRTDQGEDLYTVAALVLEDGNPKDPQAVRVEIDGLQVGYLKREPARLWRRTLVQNKLPGETLRCEANIRGGWMRRGEYGHYGVKLDLPAEFKTA